ncbi:hypothetical protein GQ600_2549 [Phytophthora cactorum]|nr:hypothetical protein GQ600_2549 [Phytophthora cactorum]
MDLPETQPPVQRSYRRGQVR